MVSRDNVVEGSAAVELATFGDHVLHALIDTCVGPRHSLPEMREAGRDLPGLVKRFGVLIPVSRQNHAGVTPPEIRRLRGVAGVNAAQA